MLEVTREMCRMNLFMRTTDFVRKGIKRKRSLVAESARKFSVILTRPLSNGDVMRNQITNQNTEQSLSNFVTVRQKGKGSAPMSRP